MLHLAYFLGESDPDFTWQNELCELCLSIHTDIDPRLTRTVLMVLLGPVRSVHAVCQN